MSRTSESAKKILFISNEGALTGAPVFLTTLIRYLKRKTNYGLLVLFSRPGELAESLALEGVEVIISEKSGKSFSMPEKIWKRLTHYIRYFKLIHAYRPDLVYSNTIANSGEVILAGMLSIPVLLHMHEGRVVASQRRYRLMASSYFARKIVVGSEYVNNVLFEITKRKGQIIYNGVPEMGVFSYKRVENGLHVRLGMLGTIHPNKGQLVAIEAVRILAAREIDAQLIIAGKSGDDVYLGDVKGFVEENCLEEYVELTGAVSSAKEFISTLDLLLVPSVDEAFPTVILEAFSTGTPTIASNVGGIPEIIEDGITGFLFQAGDPEMLANVIEKIVFDKRLLDKISWSAFKIVSDRFDEGVSNNQILNCLDSMLMKQSR